MSLSGSQIEYVLVAERDLREVAAGRVHDALGLRRRARGVEQVEQLLAVEVLGRAVVGRGRHHVVPPQVAPGLHRRIGVAPVDDDDVLDGRRARERGVDVGLEQRRRATPVAGVGGDDESGLGVVAPVADRVGREPAEDHRMRHADAGAGQHGHRQLGHHRHVDGDAVTGTQTQRLQHVGELADLAMQIAIREDARVARLALPVVRDAVAETRREVTVEAVVRDVERAAREPLGEGKFPFERRVEVGEPTDELAGLAGPEGDVVTLGLFVEASIGHQRPRLELGRGRERALLEIEVRDRWFGHCRPLALHAPRQWRRRAYRSRRFCGSSAGRARIPPGEAPTRRQP